VLTFLDGDVGVGSTGYRSPSIETAADLLGIMDTYGIGKALVYDRHAYESGIVDRFDGISDFCAGQDRLLPVIPAVPPACGEQPPPDELVRTILDTGIAAVRVSPKTHNFDLTPLSMGTLFDELEQHRVPVLVNTMPAQGGGPWNHEPDWRGIVDTALAFPELPMIVVYTGMLQGRRLLPILERCHNVAVDLTCHSFQFMEFVVSRFGSRRLVVASHLPWEDPGLYTTWVTYSDISPEAKEDIAHNNLHRLIEAAG
jgi:predicted TIM-barrel fold metal-dependent hydrolase